jgi:hypothetical protein
VPAGTLISAPGSHLGRPSRYLAVPPMRVRLEFGQLVEEQHAVMRSVQACTRRFVCPISVPTHCTIGLSVGISAYASEEGAPGQASVSSFC